MINKVVSKSNEVKLMNGTRRREPPGVSELINGMGGMEGMERTGQKVKRSDAPRE